MLEPLRKSLNLPYRLAVPYEKGKGKKPTVVLVHGIGGSTVAWEEVLPLLPDVHVLSVDLLGFGRSPKPLWVKYSLDDHVRSLRWTLKRQFVHGPVIFIGHSLGALLAIEYARRWPGDVDRLLLCSPPLYVTGKSKRRELDDMIVRAYTAARTYPVGAAAIKFFGHESRGLGFMVDDTNWTAFIRTLEASIEQQKSYEHLVELDTPTDIIYGRFDTLIIEKRIKQAAAENPSIDLHKINTAHPVTHYYAKEIVHVLKEILELVD